MVSKWQRKKPRKARKLRKRCVVVVQASHTVSVVDVNGGKMGKDKMKGKGCC